MKRKRTKSIVIVSVLLVLVAIFAAVLIYDAFRDGKTEDVFENVTSVEDMQTLAQSNADTAFLMLSEDDNALPDDVRGYYVNFSEDIDMTGSEEQARESVENVFDDADAISPNTVIIPFELNTDYTVGDTDCMSYLAECAENEGLKVIFQVSADTLIKSSFEADLSNAEEILSGYSPCGIMLSGVFDLKNAASADIISAVSELKEYCGEYNIKIGLDADEAISDMISETVSSSAADFIFVRINSSSEENGESIIQSWASLALTTQSKVCAVIRNDLVATGNGWTKADEVITQVKMLYNYGGFSGCVMYSREKLSEDDNSTASNLYYYYEYFNNIDYTTIELTGFDIADNETVTITGMSDSDYPVFAYSTSSGLWQTVDNSGEDGSFAVELQLIGGENKISVKHRNAMYTYYIDKAVDVMTDYSAVISDGCIAITVTALTNSNVWASLANTVLVELEPVSESGDYSVYTAEYELSDSLSCLTEDLVSYAAEYNGIDDIVLCTEEADITPYNDHSLGNANMCVITEDYAETTSTAAEDDSSDPTCTPQLSGSYGYVQSYMVSENYVIYVLSTGMKIYAADSRLILDGYVLPDNSVNLESVDTSDDTTVTISSDYPVFVKFNLAPQEYYEGYLQRIYNVEEFTAEYVDIIFMDTAACSVSEEPDFSGSSVIASAEWYQNTEENFITLRLYLRESGSFSGYSYSRNENGDMTVSFKTDKTELTGAVIMLDPGHGGYGSPGTSLNNQIYEKDITLAIALKTAEILEEYGAQVILTRTEDEAVSLSERVEMIRTVCPDVFVSIHCDGSEDTSLLGTHTFYYKSYSMPLAYSIHSQLVNAYRNYYYTDTESEEYSDLDMGYKFFPYMVTRVEECPSVLVECGYLTNTQDAAFLSDETGQEILATAIAQGITDYIINY
ncbi:MAG: N-acetylmuramoyl-L-alanine amidase [Clostridiales bacterium]|nr:N-acetylmuramoyl-L-alanine amidase [Clostridiales bacterium]